MARISKTTLQLSTSSLVKKLNSGDKAIKLEVIKRAREGDRLALGALISRDNRTGLDVQSLHGQTTERSLIYRAVGNEDPYLTWLFEQDQKRLRQELAGENASPMEWILAEQIAMATLAANFFEANYYQNAGEMNIRQAEFHLKRINSAHRRLQSSLKTLALIRRLEIPGPAVQVNVTQQNMSLGMGPNAQVDTIADSRILKKVPGVVTSRKREAKK